MGGFKRTTNRKVGGEQGGCYDNLQTNKQSLCFFCCFQCLINLDDKGYLSIFVLVKLSIYSLHMTVLIICVFKSIMHCFFFPAEGDPPHSLSDSEKGSVLQ